MDTKPHSTPVLISTFGENIVILDTSQKDGNSKVNIKNECLYINAKNVRKTIGGPAEQSQVKLLEQNIPASYKEYFVQYTFKSENELWFVFINKNKINKILSNYSDKNIKTIYLVNDKDEQAVRLIPPSLSEIKNENGTLFKLNCIFKVIDNKIRVSTPIKINFT